MRHLFTASTLVALVLLPAWTYGPKPGPDINLASGVSCEYTVWSANLRVTLKDNCGVTGTFGRTSTSVCDDTTVTGVIAGQACTDATYGTRIAPSSTNLTIQSEAANTWTVAGGASVTADTVLSPVGDSTAERLQMAATGDWIYDPAPNVAAGYSLMAHSVWLKTHSGGNCVVWIGNQTAVIRQNKGYSVAIDGTWRRYNVASEADITGTSKLLVGRLSGTDTCTDIDIWGAQTEQLQSAVGQYCTTAGAAATCGAETLTWPSAERIDPAQGTLTLHFVGGSRSSWEIISDATIFEVELTAGTWTIGYDATADRMVASIGGVTAAIPATWAPWTDHSLTVTWENGSPVYIQWDDLAPQASSGNYSTPTLAAAGDLCVGSTCAGSGAVAAYYHSVAITKAYSVPTVTDVYANNLLGDLAPEVGATSMTHTRATAWLCIAAGGGSLGIVAINTPCYRSEAHDLGGPDGDLVGVRLDSTTNYVRGDVDGTVGWTPLGWNGTAADWFKISADAAFEGANPASQTRNILDATQVIYHAAAYSATNPVVFSYWFKTDGLAVIGNGYVDNSGGANQTLIEWPISNSVWINMSRMFTAYGTYAYLGYTTSYGTPPTAGTTWIDAIQAERNKYYRSTFCDGAAGVSCGPDSLTVALTAGELSATGPTTLILVVTTLWGSTRTRSEAGIDRYVFDSGGPYIWWDHSDQKWCITGGGQTACTLTQYFAPFSSHILKAYYTDGSPLTISINGEAAVSSAGNKAAQALAATKRVGDVIAGGSVIAGHVGYMEIR